ncbi:MAG: restriction endonuclease subunit S [Fibrobacter sp.]|nr:restriction endonuclease subunit S [Fibrobacter sp.]
MKKYARYKDSGISWIGDVPEHWDVVRNKNFIDEKDEVVGEKFRDYTLLSLTKGGVIARDVESGKGKFPKDFESYKIVQPGNVIFCLFDVDETPRTVGLSSLRGMITGAYDVFEPININARYYAYYFLAVDDRKALRPLYTGLRKVVKKDRFLACKIPVPPLPEQKAIAEYLDKKTAQINELVSAKQKQIELLKEYKQSVIANAVTGKLDERREKRKWKDSGISWIGKIPENWEIKRVASFFDENKVLNKDFSFKKAYQFKFGTLVMKNEVGDEKDYEETYVKYTVLKKNDIVLNGLNLNYDFVSQRVAICPTPGIITSAYIAMTPRKTIEAMYYLWLFKTMDNKKMLHGMGSGIRLTLSFSDMKNQRIPVPPLSEQKEIVAYIEKKVSSIDSQIASIENQIANLNEYKQSLISDVVTGKVKV